MPRHRPYIITLSPHERSILERLARQYTWPDFQVVRARMILLAAEGYGNDYDDSIATPFDWRFTKDDLAALMQKLDRGVTALPVAAYQDTLPHL